MCSGVCPGVHQLDGDVANAQRLLVTTLMERELQIGARPRDDFSAERGKLASA